MAVGTGRWKRKTDVRFDLTVLLKYDKTHELKVNPSFVIHVLTLIRFELVAVKFDMAQYPYEEMSLSTWLTNTQQTHMIHR